MPSNHSVTFNFPNRLIEMLSTKFSLIFLNFVHFPDYLSTFDDVQKAEILLSSKRTLQNLCRESPLYSFMVSMEIKTIHWQTSRTSVKLRLCNQHLLSSSALWQNKVAVKNSLLRYFISSNIRVQSSLAIQYGYITVKASLGKQQPFTWKTLKCCICSMLTCQVMSVASV